MYTFFDHYQSTGFFSLFLFCYTICAHIIIFSHRDNIDDHLEWDHRLTSSIPIGKKTLCHLSHNTTHNIYSHFLSISTSFSACHAKFIINLNLETFELISVFILSNLQVKAFFWIKRCPWNFPNNKHQMQNSNGVSKHVKLNATNLTCEHFKSFHILYMELEKCSNNSLSSISIRSCWLLQIVFLSPAK